MLFWIALYTYFIRRNEYAKQWKKIKLIISLTIFLMRCKMFIAASVAKQKKTRMVASAIRQKTMKFDKFFKPCYTIIPPQKLTMVYESDKL